MIPIEVMKAAEELVNIYGPCLKHLGKLEDKDVFVYMFYHGEVDGFPFVFLYEEGKPVEKNTGHDALVIVSSFSE